MIMNKPISRTSKCGSQCITYFFPPGVTGGLDRQCSTYETKCALSVQLGAVPKRGRSGPRPSLLYTPLFFLHHHLLPAPSQFCIRPQMGVIPRVVTPKGGAHNTSQSPTHTACGRWGKKFHSATQKNDPSQVGRKLKHQDRKISLE